MIFKKFTSGASRIKKGFAFLPVKTNKLTIWFQHYTLRQYYNSHDKVWTNDYFIKPNEKEEIKS